MITVRTYDALSGAILSEDSFDVNVKEEGSAEHDGNRGRIFAGGIGTDSKGKSAFMLRVYDAETGRFLWEGQLNLLKVGEGGPTRASATISPANLLIHQFLDITCNPGDRVVLFTPAFPSYWAAAAHQGLQVRPVPLSEHDGFHLTRQAIDDALAAEPRAIVVNNANNPTGALYDPTILRALAARCEEAGIWLLSDETYADLTFNGSFVTLASARAGYVVAMSSFSKVCSIPGFRTGYAFAHEAVAAKLALSNSTLYSCLPLFTQLGCLAGMKVLDTYANEVRSRGSRLIGSCHDRINRSGILHCHKPESGFYLFVDIARTGLDDMTFCRRLLDDHQTAVTPGRSFGEAYASFIRIAVCGQEEDVDEGLSRTIAFAQQLGGCRVQAA